MLKTGYNVKGEKEPRVEQSSADLLSRGIKTPKHPDCPQQTSLVVSTIALTTIDGAE
jgi:hypothetical protein